MTQVQPAGTPITADDEEGEDEDVEALLASEGGNGLPLTTEDAGPTVELYGEWQQVWISEW